MAHAIANYNTEKTATIGLYQFDEIDRQIVRKNAIDKVRKHKLATDREWYKCVIRRFKEALKYMGFENVEVSVVGGGACGGASFTANWYSPHINVDTLQEKYPEYAAIYYQHPFDQEFSDPEIYAAADFDRKTFVSDLDYITHNTVEINNLALQDEDTYVAHWINADEADWLNETQQAIDEQLTLLYKALVAYLTTLIHEAYQRHFNDMVIIGFIKECSFKFTECGEPHSYNPYICP